MHYSSRFSFFSRFSFRALMVSAIGAGAAAGCAGPGGGGASRGEGGDAAEAGDRAERAMADAAVVAGDRITFPAASVPASLLGRIDDYRAAVTPRYVERVGVDRRGAAVHEDAVDMADLLEQEAAAERRGVQKVVLRGDRQSSLGEGPVDASAGNATGYLRRAIGYERRGDEVVVFTAPAVLNEYFRDLTLGRAPAPAAGAGVRREALRKDFDVTLLDVEGVELLAAAEGGGGEANASAELERARAQLRGAVEVEFDIAGAKLTQALVRFDAQFVAEAVVAARASAAFRGAASLPVLDEPVKIALPRLGGVAGAIPLTLAVDVVADCSVDAAAAVSARVGAGVDAALELGFEFEGGAFRPIKGASFEADVIGPEAEVAADADVRCALRPQIDLLVFDKGGPSLAVELAVDGSFRAAPPAAEVSATLDVTLDGAVRVPVFGELIDLGRVELVDETLFEETFDL
jgi:hypothetical protein